MRGSSAQTKIVCSVFWRAAIFLLLTAAFLRAEKLPFKSYTTSDGLAHDRVSRIVKDSRGFLWFCTSEGLSRFDGYEFKNYTQDDGLPHRSISDFLETRGGDWSEPTELRTVNLSLSAGKYRFLVRAVNSEGATSGQPAIVAFQISRPVWQRWWFLILAASLIGFLIYSLYRYRVAQLLKLERVRTRIATDLHDDIGSSLSQIAILSEVVRQKVGDNGANEPLNLIANTSREMVDSMSDIVWAINPNKDHLADLIQRMRRFASDILDAKDIAYRFYFDEKPATFRSARTSPRSE